MAKILGFGVAVLDLVHVVAGYPHEDAKVRALAQWRRCGGNAANTLSVLAQFGHHSALCGSLARDANAQAIAANLATREVALTHAEWYDSGSTPVSCITLSQENSSRTIVHYRDLAETSLRHMEAIPVETFDWLHFEGRNIPAVRMAMENYRERLCDQTVSLEVEKDREDIETLLPYADVIVFAKSFALDRGYTKPEHFVQWAKKAAPHAMVVAPWGEVGAYAVDFDGRSFFAAAPRLPMVVDTIGAGDVFNAGLIHAFLFHKPLPQALAFAVRLASHKVAQEGMEGLGGMAL